MKVLRGGSALLHGLFFCRLAAAERLSKECERLEASGMTGRFGDLGWRDGRQPPADNGTGRLPVDLGERCRRSRLFSSRECWGSQDEGDPLPTRMSIRGAHPRAWKPISRVAIPLMTQARTWLESVHPLGGAHPICVPLTRPPGRTREPPKACALRNESAPATTARKEVETNEDQRRQGGSS